MYPRLEFAASRFASLLCRFLSLSTGALLAPAAARFMSLLHKRRVRRPLRPPSSGAATAIIISSSAPSLSCLHWLLLLIVLSSSRSPLLCPLALCPITDAVFSSSAASVSPRQLNPLLLLLLCALLYIHSPLCSCSSSNNAAVSARCRSINHPFAFLFLFWIVMPRCVSFLSRSL